MKLLIGKQMGVKLVGKPCCETGALLAQKPAFSQITCGDNVHYEIEIAIDGLHVDDFKLKYCPGCGEKIVFDQVKKAKA